MSHPKRVITRQRQHFVRHIANFQYIDVCLFVIVAVVIVVVEIIVIFVVASIFRHFYVFKMIAHEFTVAWDWLLFIEVLTMVAV